MDDETVETHITMGKLFRRRGEIENAIRVHQNLIARPHLEGADRSLALLELGKDYRSAGVLDRAEGLFKEVVEAGHHPQRALLALRELYILENEWAQAIETSIAYERLGAEPQNRYIAHYYCELALEERKKGNADKRKTCLKKALEYDAYCLRANLILATVAFEQAEYTEALSLYMKVIDLDRRFASEVFPKMIECLKHTDSRKQRKQVETLFSQMQSNGVYLQALVQHIQDEQGINAAKGYLEEVLQSKPAIQPLKDWLALHPLSVDAKAVKTQVEHLDREKYAYQCEDCGYSSRRIQWHCPSCSHWGSIFPVHR